MLLPQKTQKGTKTTDLDLWYLHRWLANDHSRDLLENMERPALAQNADSGIKAGRE